MKTAISLFALLLTGCGGMYCSYTPTIQTHFEPSSIDTLQVYYDPESVPFQYQEIGKIHLSQLSKRIGKDPSAQINRIKKEASELGADAVILIKNPQNASSRYFLDRERKEIYRYSALAIVKQRT